MLIKAVKSHSFLLSAIYSIVSNIFKLINCFILNGFSVFFFYLHKLMLQISCCRLAYKTINCVVYNYFYRTNMLLYCTCTQTPSEHQRQLINAPCLNRCSPDMPGCEWVCKWRPGRGRCHSSL